MPLTALEAKAPDALTGADVDAFLAARPAETETLEYKRDADPFAIRRAVCALANAYGGTFVLGIEEGEGVAADVLPIPDCNTRARRIEQNLAANMSPPLPGLAIRAIPTDGDAGVIVVRVPASVRRPHSVSKEGRGDALHVFVQRGAETRPADIREVQDMTLSATTQRRQVLDRIAALKAPRLADREALRPVARPPNALRLAALANERPRSKKSARAVTRDVLDRLIATCAGGRLSDTRDCALLLIAFGSGGRRRSEIARLAVEDLVERSPVPAARGDLTVAMLRSLALRLGCTKTSSAERDERVVVVGRPVDALMSWLAAADITAGPIFRPIDRWDRVREGAMDPQSVNAVLKRRRRLAGLDDVQYSAHGLRSGYLTEAARKGVPLVEAMRQTRHRFLQQASTYYNEVEIEQGESARLG